MVHELKCAIAAILIAFFFLLYVVAVCLAVSEFQWGNEIRMRPEKRLAKKADEKRKGPE